MSDLVGNPEDRFSHVAAQIKEARSLVIIAARKLNFCSFAVSDFVALNQ